MPFIVKSTKDGRTVKPTENIQNEAIEALKGLTMKFEIELKLVDIIQSSGLNISSIIVDSSSTTKPDENKTSPIKIPPIKIDLNVEEKPSVIPKAQEAASQPKQETTDPIMNRDHTPNKTPAREPPQPSENTRTLEMRSVPPNLIPPQARINKPAPAPAAPVSKTPPVNKVDEPKQAFQVGETIEACAVSYIDGSNPPSAYLSRSTNDLVKITELIKLDSDRLNAMPGIKSAFEGQIILAKSHDDQNWYRAQVESVYSDMVDVYFMDWGMKESLKLDRIRPLNNPQTSLQAIPPCAVKVMIVLTDDDVINEFAQCEDMFKAKVLEYDAPSDQYSIRLVSKV